MVSREAPSAGLRQAQTRELPLMSPGRGATAARRVRRISC